MEKFYIIISHKSFWDQSFKLMKEKEWNEYKETNKDDLHYIYSTEITESEYNFILDTFWHCMINHKFGNFPEKN